MVVIKKVSAKSIFDSRREKTIFISIDTNVGKFSASSPTGKSTGKYEAKPYMKSLEKGIEILKKFTDYFSDENIDNFYDLRRIEDIVDRHIGANTLFALESAILKAMAKEQKKEVWQIINPKLSRKTGRFPRLVGNCIGGGKHSKDKKPDFQEFLLIPNMKSLKGNQEKNKEIKEKLKYLLKIQDEKFKEEKNDENAWSTSLNEKEVLEILKNLKLPFGVDVAASSFYKRKKYHYQNPVLERTIEEQFAYISNLVKNFNLFYIEDPFNEDDFESFAKLLKKFPNSLIVGDDLTATNIKRLEKAIEMKSVNALIIKPNQNGSLINVDKVCNLARKNNI